MMTAHLVGDSSRGVLSKAIQPRGILNEFESSFESAHRLPMGSMQGVCACLGVIND